MNINNYINLIEEKIKDPKEGLPEEVFLLISRITPLINVDLLIKNNNNQILLTWRQKGQIYPEGWHIPGGIIRYKEKIFDRIKKVANKELNCEVSFDQNPLAINEIMLNQKNRGHFVSLLFSCKLISEISNTSRYTEGEPKIGQWKWYDRCPKNLILPHMIYKNFFKP